LPNCGQDTTYPPRVARFGAPYVYSGAPTPKITMKLYMKRLFVLWMFFFGVAPMTAAAAGVNLAVTRTELPVHLDGFAYEDFWGDAESLSGFSVYEPNTGIKKEVDASAKIVLGKEALYFFVTVKNGDASLFAPFEQRDRARGDRVVIQLDPYGTGRRG